MTPEQRKLLENYCEIWGEEEKAVCDAIRAALNENDALRKDRERLDKLQEMQVDDIYLIDGQIVDVGGMHDGDVRKAIDGIEVQP